MAYSIIPRAPIEIQVDGADPRIKFVAVSEANLLSLQKQLAVRHAEIKRLRRVLWLKDTHGDCLCEECDSARAALGEEE